MTTISLTLPASTVTLAQGRATVTASVTNGATVPARIALGAFGDEGAGAGGAVGAAAWTTIDRSLREIPAGATEQFTVTFAPPPAIEAGSYPVRFIAYSADQAPEEYADQARRVEIVVPALAPATVVKKRWWPLAAIIGALLLVAAVVVYLVLPKDADPAIPSPSVTPSATVTPSASESPSTPTQLSPANGAVFDVFPRTTTLEWAASSGAVSYNVEIDCLHCCVNNQWCTDVGKTWKVATGLTSTSYTFDYVGAQPGRWRVWAVSASGVETPMSDWWIFTYTR